MVDNLAVHAHDPGMPPRGKKLLAEIVGLPKQERPELVRAIGSAILPDARRTEWLEEIGWRIDRIESGQSAGRALDDEELAGIFFGRDGDART